MITAIAQFKLPEPLTHGKAKEVFSSTAPRYREVHQSLAIVLDMASRSGIGCAERCPSALSGRSQCPSHLALLRTASR